MKLRSVWVVMVASTMLAISTQTDLAFAALSSITSNSSPQSISSGSWIVFAGANSSSPSTGLPFANTPWAQSCAAASQISKTVNAGAWTNTGRSIVLNDVTNLTVGMAVTGTGISGSGTNRITTISVANKRITLTSGVSTSALNTTLYFDAAATVNGGWSTSTTKISVSLDITTGIGVGMTVTGTGIINSGTNTVAAINTGSRTITLTTGGNTSVSNTVLVFKNAPICTNTFSEMFNVNNTGTIDVAKVSFTLSSGSVSLQKCSVAWTEISGAGSCVGGTATSITANGISQTFAVPAGGTIRLRAVSSVANAATTISVAVSTADLRPAVNTNQ